MAIRLRVKTVCKNSHIDYINAMNNRSITESIVENDPLSAAFNEILKAANFAASSLVQLGISLTQTLFESDTDWIKRLKELDPDSFNSYKDAAAALKQLNDVIQQYESLKKENNIIILNERTVTCFLDYIPMVRKQISNVLTEPERPELKETFDKIKNTYHEFMTKAKYIVPELRKMIVNLISSISYRFNDIKIEQGIANYE